MSSLDLRSFPIAAPIRYWPTLSAAKNTIETNALGRLKSWLLANKDKIGCFGAESPPANNSYNRREGPKSQVCDWQFLSKHIYVYGDQFLIMHH